MKNIAEFMRVLPGDILGHERLAMARAAYIDAVLAVYEANPAAIELMLDAGRILVFGIIMCLWGRYTEADRTTWPTVSLLKAALLPYGVASPRQIDHIVGRLVQTGYVEVTEAPRDNRLRLVLPTARMLSHDRLWLRAHYLPLAELFGEAAYALPLRLDVAFQRHQHAAAFDTLAAVAQQVVRPNLPILHFMTRSAGMLILMKLIQQTGNPDGSGPSTITQADLSALFGVSRTHVRDLLGAASDAGHLGLDGGRVRLSPGLVAAFDLQMAGGMSMHDREHRVAMARLGA